MRILVVDDEPTLRSVISQVLTEDGHEDTEAANGEEAKEKFRRDPYPLVLTDIVMGEMSGLDLLNEVKTLEPSSVVVLMTSHASLKSAQAAIRSGADDYLIKPFDELEVISSVVNRATQKIRQVDRNRSMMETLKRSTEELQRVNETLFDAAHHDPLTGLHNLRHFRDVLDSEISRCARHERVFSLLFVDVDHFKRYNDTYGHLAGDEILKQIAGILADRARRSDVVARYGGEEFVAILPETTKEGALELAESVRSIVAAYPFEGQESQPLNRVTVSVGVASFPEDGTDALAIIDYADRALYEAKRLGRDRVCD